MSRAPLPATARAALPAGSFVPGAVLSVLAGLTIAGVGLGIALDWQGLVLLVMLAAFWAIPLGVAWLLALAYLLWARRRAPRWAWRWMLLPPVLGAAVWGGGQMLLDAHRAHALRAYPPVHELHINLSGQDLAPDTRGLTHRSGGVDPLLRARQLRFLEVTRWRDAGTPPAAAPNQGYDALYERAPDGLSMRPKASHMLRWQGTAPDDAPPWPEPAHPAPLVAAPALPDMTGLPAQLRLSWLYAHYAGHTEAAPFIALSGMDSLAMQGRWGAWMQAHLLNDGPSAIVRWQVNGQELPTGHSALPLRQQTARRCDRWGGGYLRAPPDPLWQVRWQTLDAPGQWKQALVHVPGLARSAGHSGEVMSQRVDFHLTPDGRWLAQRVQVIGLREFKGLRVTPLGGATLCGSAERAWHPPPPLLP
ncbi:hypothetical protein EII20_13250 [Comamonadaceae bacterium OH2545_COT-014]|nr:hypothetical protein EII20_13250 [Comamonadaceae bacterium OH2545_COT-014]